MELKYGSCRPNNIGDLLTPLGLAHWIMQDGSYHKV